MKFREDSLAPELLVLPPLPDLEERADTSGETQFGFRIRRRKGNKARLGNMADISQQRVQ